MIDVTDIKWKPVIIGVFIGAILGSFLNMIGYILAGIFVGYYVGKDYMNGAFHGAIANAIGAFIGAILILSNDAMHYLFIAWAIYWVCAMAIIGGVTGAVGALIKEKARE